MNKKTLLSLMMLLCFAFMGAARADETLTVHDGTATNGYVPVYGYYSDAFLKCEMLYSADELAALTDNTITNMVFYASQSNVDWGNANFQVFLTEIGDATINYFNGQGPIVYEGPLSIENGEMVITFTEPYTYYGGNLLIGLYNTVKGSFVTSTWYGESVNGASVQGYSYNSLDEINPTQRNFLPKTTFTYVNCATPTGLASSNVTSTTATLNWTENGDSESWYIFYSNILYSPTPGPVGPTPPTPGAPVFDMHIEVTENPYTLTGLEPNTEYEAIVVPSCGVSVEVIDNDYYYYYDLYSDILNFTTLEQCPTPQNVAVTNITETEATVTWSDYNDVYQLEIGSPSDNIDILLNENFDNGLPNGWNNNSSYPWTIIDGHMQSGNAGVSNSTSSISLSMYFDSDGTIQFDAECKGEGAYTAYDICTFSIDDEPQFSYGAGISGWNHYSFDVTAGEHTLTWSYSKDPSINPDGDYFAVDNVIISINEIAWGDPVEVLDPSYTFTGLDPVTEYYVHVMGVCGLGSPRPTITGWSEPLHFTTLGYYTVTAGASPANGGTVTGGGVYYSGDTCTLTATENLGYYLYNWTKGGEQVGNYYDSTYTFVVTENANIVANFQQIEYYPYITSMPEGGGWGEIVGLDYATSGAIHYGDAVTLRAIPNEDFRFYKWTMWVGTDNDYYEIDLSTDTLYTFTFDENFVGFDAGNQGEIEFVANFVESIGDCVRPLDLTATEVGPTSATLSWTELGTSQAWMMYYRPAFTPAYVPYDSLEIYQNPYTLTGLQPNTAYEAYIVPSCGFTDGIANEYLASNTVTFTTLEACPAPFNLQVSNITHNSATVAWTGYNDEYTFSYRVATELIDPVFSEGFEGGVIPQGWSNQGDASWEVGVGDYTPDTINAHSGNYNAKITHNNSQEQTYFVMPSMNLGGQNDLVLSFWYINRSWGDDIDELGVYYRFGTEGAQGAWQPLWSTTEAHETWTNQVVELTGLSDNYQIGFLFTDHYGYGVGLDDIIVATEVVSEWVTIDNVTSPLALADLTPNTNYEVRVQGLCDDMITNWSNSAFFTTAEAQNYTITVSANPAAGGTVTGTGTYTQGSNCTVTATATTGYTFTNWTENGNVVSTSPTYSFTVTTARTLVANFSINNYAITVTANPTEGGTVTGDGTYNHGARITLTATANTGYTFTGWSDGITTNPREVIVTGTATYTANFQLNSYTLTINYKYANDTIAAPSHTETLNYGASYSVTSPSITGYTPDQAVVEGTMGAGDVTVDVTYNVNSYTLTINYKYANGTTAAPSHIESLNFGASYSVTSPTIAGYTPSLPVVEGTMGAEDVTVDVTYSDNSYTLTINYLFADGTTAAPTHIENVSYGASYSVTSPTITGYTPNLEVVEGTMGAGDVTVDVTYNINSYTLTINYKYANGATAATSHTESLNYGASYSVTSPSITGYTPDQAVVSGTMGAEDVTVDVTYNINSYTLTINYKYANGATAATSHIETLNFGTSYSVTSPSITGYTPNLEVVSGTMGAEDVTVDVTYNINSYTLTINYKYADGTMAAASHIETLNYGASYSVTSPTITGYTPSLPVVSGTMGAEDVTVDVTYSDNSYTLTINYLFADGTTAAPTHIENVSYGASYSVTSPSITGYTPDQAVVSGTMGAEDVTVDVTYNVNSYTLTINYKYANGTTAAASHIETLDFGASYSVTSPSITGYTPDQTVVEGTMGAGDVTVDVTYNINSYTLTINYKYADGTMAAASHVETLDFGASYSVTSPSITGYTPDQAVVTGTMGAEDVTVDVTYNVNSYTLTINYKYANGTTAAASHIDTLDFGASYSVTSPSITGYTPDQAVVEGTMGAGDVTVDVTYNINSYTLTINYKYANGTTAAASHIETLDFGASYSVTSPSITGYTPDQTVVEGTMGAGDVTVDVTYNINSYTLTINYKYANGTTAAASHIETLDFGASYSVTSPSITGYTPDQAVVTGTMGAGDVTVDVTYNVNSYTLTINYKYANGTTAAASHIETLDFGASYSVTSPSITGYTPDQTVVTGTMGAEDVTVDVTYNVNSYTLTINYKYANGATAATSHVETLDFGASYSVTSPSITGYTPDQTVVTGTMGAEDVTVDVTYNVNSYTLTINYKYANGTTAAASHIETLDFGASYSVTSPSITGYTPDQTVVEGTMGAGDMTIDVTYTVNSYQLTINYKYADGAMAAPTYTESVDYGATYSVTSPDITGYTPNLTVVTGTMGAGDVTIDVTYTVNSYQLTINYKYADGTMAAPTYTESVDYGDTYSVTSPDITGYTPNLTVVTGTMGAGDVTIDVTYTVNSYQLTINYKYADGTTAAPTYTESVDYGDTYSVTSPDITGYTPNLTVVTGTMGAENVTVDVTYTINSYIISASANPTVGGSVNGAGTYNHFATAELTAIASTGYTFINWTENGTVISTSPTISFMVEGPRTLVANFQLNSYQITAIANPTAGGTATGTGTYNHFESCTLVATPNEYYVFTNWTKNGQVVSDNATYTFTVEGGGTYVAHFTRVNHQITVLANPTEGGSVSGEGSYPHGSYCTLTATANTGYTFFNWTKNGVVVSSNPSYSFPVTEDATYVANFNLNNFLVTVAADPAAGGSVYGGGAYLFGSNCTVSAMANAGYTFTNWTVNGTVVSTDANYTFPVNGNTDLIAHFSLNHYNITVSVDPEVGGSATGGGSFTYGETCTLVATANTGYAFINWTKNGTVVSSNASYSFSVNDGGDYVAHFAVARYTLTVLAEPADGGRVYGGGTYDYGHAVVLRAIANEGYEFINWTKNGDVVSSNANYSVVVREDAEYKAHFQIHTYEIKAHTEPFNTGLIEGAGFYNYGDICTLSVDPYDEYEFICWTLDGQVVSEEASFSFVVTEGRDYVAHLQSDGLVEQSGITVSLYPNPAKRRLTIEASEPVNMLEIYNINGALVYKQTNCSDKVEINVTTYAPGTYMIRLTTDSAVETRRFVKE